MSSCPSVELLAESPCARVTRCDGGHLHLTVGPVTRAVSRRRAAVPRPRVQLGRTICMGPAVFEALILTLRDAQARMAEGAKRHLELAQ